MASRAYRRPALACCSPLVASLPLSPCKFSILFSALPQVSFAIRRCLAHALLPARHQYVFTQGDLLSSLQCHSTKLTTLYVWRSGEAMSHGLLQKAMVSELFLVVALTMALTPLLAEIGSRLGKAFEKSDVKVRYCLFILPSTVVSLAHASIMIVRERAPPGGCAHNRANATAG